MIKYAVGIDIGSKECYACMSTIDATQRVKVVASTKFSNTASGFRLLEIWITKHHKQKEVPLTIGMEATGVYYENCALFFSQRKYRVTVILANRAKDYLKATGIKTKTDKSDAQGLAQMICEQALPEWTPMSPFFFHLRTLTRQHQRLQEIRTEVSNQLLSLEASMYVIHSVTKQLKATLTHIDKQVAQLEELIKKHLMSNPDVFGKVERIAAIKGLGMLTVAVLIAETNGFDLFENSRQLISYSGYDVIENSSGKRVGKTRISKQGNSRIRRALYMPAFNTVRYRIAPFIHLYLRTYERHHIKMKSYVAVQKKLLVIIYALFKNGENFRNMPLIAEEEAAIASRLSAIGALKKGSPPKGATEGRQLRQLSASNASRLVQN
ncbi:MAG: IS110 family transposase [Chitinophagales bacterium]